MRTFNQSNKSKKSLKKEAKKAAMADEGNSDSGSPEIADDGLDTENSSPDKKMFDAREKLRSKTMKKPKKKELESPVKPPVSSFDSDEEEYKRKRSIMAGPKKTLT